MSKISTLLRRSQQVLFLTALSLSAVGALLWILKAAPAPFFWEGLTLAATLIAAIFFAHRPWVRALLFNVAVVAIALAVVEAYCFCTIKSMDKHIPDGFNVPDDVLGWAPAKGTQAHAFELGPAGLLHGPRGFVYDTTYTIDSNGLRVAPPWRKDALAGTVLFFGCSFTFGDGLPDDETLPYQVGVQSGGRYRTFNFGYIGYSPAQMLAEIEHGIVQRAVDTTPRYAYYIALPDHVWRVAGRAWWQKHAPRYVMDADGTLRNAGYYDVGSLADRLGLPLSSHVRGQLDKSAIWRIIAYRNSSVSHDDIELYFALVRRSQELLAAQFPGIQFHVILWPPLCRELAKTTPRQYVYVYRMLRDGFHRMGIPLDLVEDILPGYGANCSRYGLAPGDAHPNALADRLLAQYVLKEIPQ